MNGSSGTGDLVDSQRTTYMYMHCMKYLQCY